MPARRVLAYALGLFASSCFPPGDGISPPNDRFYFPVGTALSVSGETLLVANSDFDLQFDQGVLHSIDVDRIAEVTPRPCVSNADCSEGKICDTTATDENRQSPSFFCVATTGEFAGLPCGAFGEASAADRLLAPGRCAAVDIDAPQDGGASLIQDSVEIGAFATAIVYRARPETSDTGAPGRVFVPVRGDTTLHWIDVAADGALDCGQVGRGRCDDHHRVGKNAALDDPDQRRLPTDPQELDVTEDGTAITLSHQTSGEVSLFLNDWDAPAPRLSFVIDGLPLRPVGLAALPVPQLVKQRDLNYQQGFLVAFRSSAEVRLLRMFDGSGLDAGASDAPYLVDAGRVPISVNSTGFDSRGIAVDDWHRRVAETGCEVLDGIAKDQCLDQASATPLDVYVANRTPPSLLIGRTGLATGPTSSKDLPVFHATVPLAAGPSRVVVGDIINADGERERRIFVICFDSRLVFVYDPERAHVEAEIITGRGPHSLTIDTQRGFGYLAHFTDSYIGVLGLDQRVGRGYGQILATLGKPTAPRATK